MYASIMDKKRHRSWGSSEKKRPRKKSAKAKPESSATPSPPDQKRYRNWTSAVEPDSVIAAPSKTIIAPSTPTIIVPSAPTIIVPSKKSVAALSGQSHERFRGLLPDLDSLTSKIIEADLDHTQAYDVANRVDDLVDWAPNAIVFASDRRFLGMRPFAKQVEILLYTFEEFCFRCSDMRYMTEIAVDDTLEKLLSKVALLEFGRCPHCGATKGDGRAQGFYVDPLEIVAIVGQRAGKSVTAAICINYLIHRNLMLPIPWKTYGLAPGQIVDFTIVATTVSQTEKTLWSTFKGMLESSAWFTNYQKLCNEEGKKKGVKSTVTLAETYVWFGHKHMLVYFAANNPAGLRGTTRFGAAIDELGWFDSQENSGRIRSNGPETYAALSNACLTLRGAFANEVERDSATTWPVPLMVSISSPHSMDDPIMSVYRDSAKNKRVVRRHWATWEMSPALPKSLLIETGDLLKRTGPRDYGAQPPIADDPLIQRTDLITEAFKVPLAVDKRYGRIVRPSARGVINDLEVLGRGRTKQLTAALDTKYEVTIPYSRLRRTKKRHVRALGTYRALFKELIETPATTRNHIMGVDLGANNNALAVVCGFLADEGRKFITDFALEVKPDAMSINIADVYKNLIVPLIDKLHVCAVFYDRWSSLHHIQDLSSKFGSLGPLNSTKERRAWLRDLRDNDERPSFIAEQYSLGTGDALNLVSRLEQGDCLFPRMEVGLMELMVNKGLEPKNYPYAHLALQLATVRLRGNRLLKPANRDDDLFRAWANAAVKAFSDELIVDMLLKRSPVSSEAPTVVSAHVSLGMGKKGLRGNTAAGSMTNYGSNAAPVILRKKRG